MLVLLRRIVGGINASEQQALYRKYTSGDGSKKKRRVNRRLGYEQWRLVASLEHLLSRHSVLCLAMSWWRRSEKPLETQFGYGRSGDWVPAFRVRTAAPGSDT